MKKKSDFTIKINHTLYTEPKEKYIKIFLSNYKKEMEEKINAQWL